MYGSIHSPVILHSPSTQILLPPTLGQELRFKALATATTRTALINIARDAREKIETQRKKEVAEKRSQADIPYVSPLQKNSDDERGDDVVNLPPTTNFNEQICQKPSSDLLC